MENKVKEVKDIKEIKAKDRNGNEWKLALVPQPQYRHITDLIFTMGEISFRIRTFPRKKDCDLFWESLTSQMKKKEKKDAEVADRSEPRNS